MESTSYVLSFRIVFFLPCDNGLDFLHELDLYENSINQSNQQPASQNSNLFGSKLQIAAHMAHSLHTRLFYQAQQGGCS